MVLSISRVVALSPALTLGFIFPVKKLAGPEMKFKKIKSFNVLSPSANPTIGAKSCQQLLLYCRSMPNILQLILSEVVLHSNDAIAIILTVRSYQIVHFFKVLFELGVFLHLRLTRQSIHNSNVRLFFKLSLMEISWKSNPRQYTHVFLPAIYLPNRDLNIFSIPYR